MSPQRRVLVVLSVVVLALGAASCGNEAPTVTVPGGPPSAAPSVPGAPAAPDCGPVPPREAFSPGQAHECFPLMAERLELWLGGNAAGSADPTPADVLSTEDAGDVATVQRLMGDEPDGWFGQQEWTRLLTQGPPPPTELRTNGIGALLFGMTRAEVDASGFGTVQEPQRLADPPQAWNVSVNGVDTWGCYRPDTFYAALVKDDSPVRTVEGITTRSSLDDLVFVFGSRLEERVADWGTVWYVVRGREGGYAFFPQQEGGLIIFAGLWPDVDQVGPDRGVCEDYPE